MGRRKRFSREPFRVTVDDLSHDGRGVASCDGKKVFIYGALPGEEVVARRISSNRHFDEATAVEVLQPAAERIEPRCEHFGVCGGCALQHLEPEQQIAAKQNTLLQNLQRIGKVALDSILPPLLGPVWHYRRRARLSVRHVAAKEKVLVGFREQYGRFVADIEYCHILPTAISELIPRLSELIGSLSIYNKIPQIEVACGDAQSALVIRHLEPLAEADLESLRAFARDTGVGIFLQPKGPSTIYALEPTDLQLSFKVPEYGLEFEFSPANFIQINAAMNRLMINRAVQLLDLKGHERVLDLFCGLGNFTLPIATAAASVVGVEGDAELVELGRKNAAKNALHNAEFFTADLNQDPSLALWLKQPYDRVLIDPPRSGAESMLPFIRKSGARRVVYVSCHPASLARDAGLLVHEYGYRLLGAGVMDMFPHTGHVESIAVFERDGD